MPNSSAVQSPSFAVVGHPNKGKSSIVATLAHDDSVSIGNDPGTTQLCREYPMSVDGTVLYRLVDTPGFQRARKALAWMRKRESSPADRPGIVRDFVADAGVRKKFPDECELLAPIIAGAGILYVVDGSVPYSEEYEAELEILRWTGQPRMALINPIGLGNYIDQWQNALGQYFSVVRVFDALDGEFQKQVELLKVFGQLRSEWSPALEQAVGILEAKRNYRIERSAKEIANFLSKVILLKLEASLPEDTASIDAARNKLEVNYRNNIIQMEQRLRQSVEHIYAHKRLTRVNDEPLELSSEELFTERTWNLLGLKKRDILSYSAVAGAATGGVLDLAAGGSSLFLGAILGGAIAATTAYLTADSVVDVRILSLPLGSRILRAGPLKNINFPHVLFSRARLHHFLIANRNHGRRDAFDPQADKALLPPLDQSITDKLEKLFSEIRSQGAYVSEDSSLAETLAVTLAGDIERHGLK